MANHKSAEKRARQNEKRRRRNSAIKSAVRTAIKKFQAYLDAGDKENASRQLQAACRALDKAWSKHVLHKNNVARRKSRLARKLNALLRGEYVKMEVKTYKDKAARKARAKAVKLKALKAKGIDLSSK